MSWTQLISYSSGQFAIDQFPGAPAFTNGAFAHLAFAVFVEYTIEVCVWVGEGGGTMTGGGVRAAKEILVHPSYTTSRHVCKEVALPG